MRFCIEPPKNTKDFEQLTLQLLRRHWNAPQLQLYAHDGENQHGVDIFDPHVTSPHRAAQCKLHDQQKTLPPEEIRDEVKKALSYTPSLNQYFILTTARLSKFSDDTIKTINAEHRTNGLFTVELLTWDRIEQLLDQYTDVRDRIYKTLSSQATDSVEAKLNAVLVKIDSSIGPSSDSYDAQLDDAKRELDEFRPEITTRLIERLVSRNGDKLSQRQKWRANTLLASTFLVCGDLERAGKLLVSIANLQPEEEKARVNEAVGYELLKEQTRAHEIASVLRIDFPFSASALAVWIRTAPDSMSLADLERESGQLAQSDPEVALSLAARLLWYNQPEVAERFARVANKLAPATPQGWLLLAQAIHHQGILEVRVTLRQAQLQESEHFYGQVIELALKQGPTHSLASAYLNRGLLREQLEKYTDARDDYREAIKILPNDPDVIGRFATFLARRESSDEAVELAHRAATLTHGAEYEFLHAAALYDRNREDDREKALSVWSKIIQRGPGEKFDRSLTCAILGFCQVGRPSDAQTLLDSIPHEQITPTARLANQARISLEKGDNGAATRQALEVFAAADDSWDQAGKLSFALLLYRLKLFAEIITLLTPIARRGVFDDTTRFLLDSAMQTDNDGLVIRLCRELREVGVKDRRLRQHEFSLLSEYDPNAAGELIQEYLTDYADDHFARLRLSLLGIQCERPEWVTTDPNDLPSPREAEPAGVGQAVMNMLIHHGRTVDALNFAYELLRSHPNDPDANHAYISLFLSVDMDGCPISSPAMVEPNSAVAYREIGKEKEEWLVIEPAQPNELLNELAPNHPRAQAILGKRFGERFQLVSGIQERYGEVVAIRSKYIYRFEQTRDSYQQRFQDRRDFQLVEIVRRDSDGTEHVDPSPIFSDLDRRAKDVTELLHNYRSHATPIHTLAQILGRDIFETIAGLRCPSLGVRSWSGLDSDWTEAMSAFCSDSTFILDLTALFTIGQLDLLPYLGKVAGVSFVISQSTFDNLRNLAFEIPQLRPRAHLVPQGNGTYAWVEIPPEALNKEHEFRKKLVGWAREHCRILGCCELAELPPERREQLVMLFGRDGAESMCLATRANYVLWTDDSTLGIVAREWLPGTRRTWTQAAIWSAVSASLLDENTYTTASARLLEWNYGIVRFDSSIMIHAAIIAAWSPTTWPLPLVFEAFGSNQNSEDSWVNLATSLIMRMFYQTQDASARRTIVWAILNRLRTRKLIEQLWRGLGALLAEDKFNAYIAQRLFAGWFRSSIARLV